MKQYKIEERRRLYVSCYANWEHDDNHDLLTLFVLKNCRLSINRLWRCAVGPDFINNKRLIIIKRFNCSSNVDRSLYKNNVTCEIKNFSFPSYCFSTTTLKAPSSFLMVEKIIFSSISEQITAHHFSFLIHYSGKSFQL